MSANAEPTSEWTESPAARKIFEDAKRDVVLAGEGLPRLVAIKQAGRQMAMCARHGGILKQTVVDELYELAETRGLVEQIGEVPILSAIESGLNDFSTGSVPGDRGADAVPRIVPPLTIEEWLDRQLEPPDRLLGDVLTTTSRILIDGPTGLGKTLLGVQISMNASAGVDFVHWKAHRPCRCLYVDGEMSRRLVQQRIGDGLGRLMRMPGGERLKGPPAGFHFLCREDLEEMPALNTPEGQACIDHVVKHIGGVDLITFDSIMCLLTGDPRDPEPWQQVMPWVRQNTKKKRGQIWLHHTGHDTSRGYGDKSKEWQMDTVGHMTKVENALTDVCFTLEFTKARERTPENRADFETTKITLIDETWQSDGRAVDRKRHVQPLGLKFFDALQDALAGDTNSGRIAGRPATTLECWRSECERLGLIDPKDKPQSARALFNKHKRELIAANFIACNEERVWTI